MLAEAGGGAWRSGGRGRQGTGLPGGRGRAVRAAVHSPTGSGGGHTAGENESHRPGAGARAAGSLSWAWRGMWTGLSLPDRASGRPGQA